MYKKGYKLFEMDKDGILYPLFIDNKSAVPLNKWLTASIVKEHKGFAHRPGWHIGAVIPSAPWLMSQNGKYDSQRGKSFKRVWCEVEYITDNNYTNEVKKLPKKCFTDRLPTNGFYEFKESGNRLWIIADKIKVTKVINEEERLKILQQNKYDELSAFEPYRKSFIKRNLTNAKK